MQTYVSDCEKIKINTIEFLNTIFIFVVLFLHHSNYTTDYFSLFSQYNVTLYLQKLSIGGFIFLSGFKLTNSKSLTSFRAFFINRFFRIYLLYLISLFFFSFTAYPYLNSGEFPSLPNIILHIFCIQSIVPDLFQANYHTLWFVSILLCCYIFFLFTRKIIQKPPLFYLCLFLTSFGVFGLHKLAKHFNIAIFDKDFIIYLTFFALGMIYSNSRNKIERVNNGVLCLLFITGFVGLILFYSDISIKIVNKSTVELFFILISTIPFYLLAFKIVPKINLFSSFSLLISFMSYSSFCVFLFHRSIWAVMSSIFSARHFSQWLFIIVLGVPTIFLSSYLIQIKYDHVLSIIRKNKMLQPISLTRG
jgi:peptidoglycan/LPS O-acetylase OafA/YrhL